MASAVAPAFRVDGPLPVARPITLVSVAQVVIEDDPHWAAGIGVRPYFNGLPGTHAVCVGTNPTATKTTGSPPAGQTFGSFAVVLGQDASTICAYPYDDFISRSRIAFEATEATVVESVFMGGGPDPNGIPHLEGEATTPDGTSDVDIAEAVALLDNRIAAEIGSRGFIHMTPGMLDLAWGEQVVYLDGNQWLTPAGSVVVPGAGYVGGLPAGGDALAEGQEWIFATGPVQVRRTEIFTIPEDVSQAVDRVTNDLTAYIERYYIVDWDTSFTRAVKVNRNA